SIIETRSLEIGADALRDETLRVRGRLEKERAGRLKVNEVDLKYSQGGLLDVYFAVRYLQLRDQVPDTATSRSTISILPRLRKKRSLTQNDFQAFSAGHAFLSELDHNIRLTIGHTTRVPFNNPKAMEVIARRMQLSSTADIAEQLSIHRMEIRRTYEHILNV